MYVSATEKVQLGQKRGIALSDSLRWIVTESNRKYI
jgi:hypothetical protein